MAEQQRGGRGRRGDGEDYQAMKDGLALRGKTITCGIPHMSVHNRGQARSGGGGSVSEATRGKTWHLSLPYPPSTNALYATVNGRRVKTKAARDYAELVDDTAFVLSLGFGTPDPPYRLTIELWAPDNRRRDADNGVKCLQDALLKATKSDDAEVIVLHVVKRGVDRLHPRAEVTLETEIAHRPGGSTGGGDGLGE